MGSTARPPDARAADAHRTKALEEQGWRVVRFWNSEIMQHPNAVLAAIVRAIEG